MEEIKFLNVDLLLKSKLDLTPIITCWDKKVFVLHSGKQDNFYYSELELTSYYGNPNRVISEFCKLVKKLPDEARALWDRSIYRIFDIGYDSGTYQSSFESTLKAKVVNKIAKLDASIRVTIYPVDIEEKKK